MTVTEATFQKERKRDYNTVFTKDKVHIYICMYRRYPIYNFRQESKKRIIAWHEISIIEWDAMYSLDRLRNGNEVFSEL